MISYRKVMSMKLKIYRLETVHFTDPNFAFEKNARRMTFLGNGCRYIACLTIFELSRPYILHIDVSERS